MKTRLLQFYQSVLLIAITGSIMATPHTLPVRKILIPPNNDAITYDGLADESSYSASQSTTAYNVTGSTGADADFTASFKVCYNAERLFICFTILDEYPCEIPYTTSPSPETWDNVEVFISLDTTGTTPEYDSNTIQLRFNRGIQDSAQLPGRADQSEYAGCVYYENTADGWILEVGIPWTAVLAEGQDPEDFNSYLVDVINGFDVSCADNDTDGPDARDCQTAWDDDDPAMPDATEDLAWCDRTMFGVMIFGLTYGTPYVELTSDKVAFIEQKVFPNPASDFIYLQNIEPGSTIDFYTISGVCVLEKKQVYEGENIDISFLEPGLYTVVINNRESTRFVKE